PCRDAVRRRDRCAALGGNRRGDPEQLIDLVSRRLLVHRALDERLEGGLGEIAERVGRKDELGSGGAILPVAAAISERLGQRFGLGGGGALCLARATLRQRSLDVGRLVLDRIGWSRWLSVQGL